MPMSGSDLSSALFEYAIRPPGVWKHLERIIFRQTPEWKRYHAVLKHYLGSGLFGGGGLGVLEEE
jgi:hypothetical protein